MTSIRGDWEPAGVVELIAGTPSGGGQDRVARAVAAALLERPGVESEVVNVPGRGGGNGWDRLASSPGDPLRLAVSSPTLVTNKILGEAGIDHGDLTPLATLCTDYIAFVVPSGSELESGRQVAERMAAGGIVTAMATAIGNVNHMALGMVARHSGADPSQLAVRVFDSARYAVADLLDRNAHMAAVSAASAVPEIKNGSLRALAVSSPGRLAAPFDGVPTWSELGIDSVIGAWRGIVGSGGLSEAQVAFWEGALALAVSAPAWRAALTTHRWAATFLDAAETRLFLDDQRSVARDTLDQLGLSG